MTKSIRRWLLTAILLALAPHAVTARIIAVWPYQALFAKSDLVIIAQPTGTRDTQEQVDLPGFSGEPVIGVETRLAVSVVLKGDAFQTNIVFHHYRPAGDPVAFYRYVSSPTFISFPEVKNPFFQPTYMLFLTREADGRYAPVVGQVDPGMAVRKLASANTETNKLTEEQLAYVLKECETIQAGMTRADLAKVFIPDGGLSTARQRTYCFRTCPNIKVDVDFTPAHPQPGRLDEQPTDIISRISKPYLDWVYSD
jgi:hypothetical protein